MPKSDDGHRTENRCANNREEPKQRHHIESVLPIAVEKDPDTDSYDGRRNGVGNVNRIFWKFDFVHIRSTVLTRNESYP